MPSSPRCTRWSWPERQIAGLVSGGLSNREVATRMFISLRTVESNLSRVYRKLGVRSRTELARSYPGSTAARS